MIKPCIYCYKKHCFVLGPGDKKKTYQVYCPICESLGPWKATKTEAVEAHNQVAGLREENERLKEELKVTRHYLKHHQENSDRLINEVERLRANAIVWHKWPEEKPADYESYSLMGWDDAEELPFMTTPPRCWDEDSLLWAEIPRPEGE
jgi:uncharacterized Zn finger protein (UPF0148 family)